MSHKFLSVAPFGGAGCVWPMAALIQQPSIPERGNLSMNHQHLEPRPGSQQYYVKGRRGLRASLIVGVKESNGLTIEQVARNYRISPAVVRECIRYCKENQKLIEREIHAERIRGGLHPLEDKPLS